MKKASGLRGIVFALVVIVALVASSDFSPASPPTGQRYAALSLDSDVKRAETLVKTLGITEIMGPLAPIALTPFFSLTVLSGASLVGPALADSGIPVLDSISKNALLGKGSPLNNGFVFAGLLVLTVLTALPKLTKVTKPLAQVVDQIEGHAGIIGVVAVQMLSQISLGDEETARVSVVCQAGVITFSYTTLLAIFSAINIFVVNTVKYFFEVLIFLSPIPLVDAFFEALNKAFAALLLGLYLISPWAATLVNLLIFGICLVIFMWAYRRVIYTRSILGDPILGWLGDKIFRRPPLNLLSTPLPSSIQRRLPDPTLVLKAFATRGCPGMARKTRGYLVQSGDRLHFAAPRFLRAPRVVALPREGHRVLVEKGLLSNLVRLENDAGVAVVKVVFSRRYNLLLDAIRAQVGARSVAREESTERRGILDMGRSLKDVVKGDGRDSLRAEIA